MNRLTKRALSLALALLMVLALIPAQPLTAKAEDFTPGETWTYESVYAGKLEGAFTTSGDDFVFEADETVSWKTWLRSAVAVNAAIGVRATLTYNGQQVEKTVQGLSIAKGGTLELCSAGSFPEITDDMYGNFTLTVQVYHKTTLAAIGVLNFTRNAPAGETTEPTEATEPTEPVVLDPPTNPGEVVWTYGKSGDDVSYDWLQGAISTSNTTGIYKGWDPYDWKITLSPTKASAVVTVEANVVDHNGATVGTVTKDVEVGTAPSVTTILTPGELGLNNKTLGDFRVTAVIKYNGEAVAQVQAVFGRRIGDAGYTAVEYLPGSEWITGSFTAADEDMTYVGIQKYDWRATIAPIKSAATVDVAVTVVNAQGEIVATLNKTGVECGRGVTTALVTAGEITELTTDLYGQFAVSCIMSVAGRAYTGIYGVIERVEGGFVLDTLAPEFGPANWESCGLPAAVTVANNGKMNKSIEVRISITDAQGAVLASMNKTATVGAGATGTLVTTNQLRSIITERGATYYVVIEGRWTNGYDEYTINETLAYVWTEHIDTEVIPGYAATCTETGLTDGVYCHGCEYIITEQREILPTGEHVYADCIEAEFATCTREGYAVLACGCGETITEIIPITDHELDVLEEEIPAGCEEAGQTAVYYCYMCENIIEGGEVIPPLGHDWTNADCVNPKTCSACGATEGEALDHDMQETSAAVSADCENTGKTAVLTCSACGCTEGGEVIPPLGHDWTNADCVNPKTCSACGATEGEALGHDMQETSAEVSADCENAGKTAVLTCSACGCTEGGEVIPPLGHDWTNADCVNPKTCSACGATEGEALGHTPAEAVKENEIPATTLAEGSYDEVVYCTVCGAELSRKTVVVEKLSTVVSVVVSQDTLFRGDTVTVTVSISPLENCAAGGFLFEFDTDTFEYVSGEALVSDFGSAGVSTVNGRIAGYFMNGNETVKGSIFQITLRVKDTAAFADYTISGVPSLGVKVGDTSEHISCEANAATVTVACSHSYSQWTPIDEMWEKHTCSICGNEETQLIEYTVTFQYADGTVISEAVYHYGDTIVVPDEPPAQAANNVFVGWDKEIDVCTGNTVYTAVFVEYVPGDMDGNGIVDFEDAVYLLLNLMFGDVSYPLSYAPADIDRNGIVDYDDAVYLLLHTLFGNVIYPL